MLKHKVCLINLTRVNRDIGDYATTMAAEYIGEEFNVLLYSKTDKGNPLTVLDWLYNNIDYSEEVSDPQSLDDIYFSMSNTMSVGVFEIYDLQDYKQAKTFIKQHINNIENFDVDTRAERITITMDMKEGE